MVNEIVNIKKPPHLTLKSLVSAKFVGMDQQKWSELIWWVPNMRVHPKKAKLDHVGIETYGGFVGIPHFRKHRPCV